ncbi:unnamed protein product [Symbiodinium sp. CCMP2456]|nr:unnamed protein product [Symbiodinium sp. CCMP2456]
MSRDSCGPRAPEKHSEEVQLDTEYPKHSLQDCQGISASKLSPRTFELRLRQAARLLQDLQQLSAVSLNLASRVDGVGWSATHEYLFQEPGSKAKLRRRYAESMRQLLLKTWLRRCAAQEPEGLVAHIVSFVPG